ncbi:MAG: hypothetical protein OER95_13680 [Acidimicrobiia bacterium]|nr:hypothetical protein [Acidimicrobiia bacterium]
MVVDGETLDVVLVNPERYVPNRSEQELATTYAECATSIRFIDRLTDVQSDVQPGFLNEVHDDLEAWQSWFALATDAVAGEARGA